MKDAYEYKTNIYISIVCIVLIYLSNFILTDQRDNKNHVNSGTSLTINYPGFSNVTVTLSQINRGVQIKKGGKEKTTFKNLKEGSYLLNVYKSGMKYETNITLGTGSMTLTVPCTSLRIDTDMNPTSILVSQGGRKIFLDTEISDKEESYRVFDNGEPYAVEIDKGGIIYKENVVKFDNFYEFKGDEIEKFISFINRSTKEKNPYMKVYKHDDPLLTGGVLHEKTDWKGLLAKDVVKNTENPLNATTISALQLDIGELGYFMTCNIKSKFNESTVDLGSNLFINKNSVFKDIFVKKRAIQEREKV